MRRSLLPAHCAKMRDAKPLRPGRIVRLAMLERCGGNRAEAARRLGMQQHNFCRWLWTVARAEGTAHLPRWRQVNGPPVGHDAYWHTEHLSQKEPQPS